jgi:excisionase family DNA binding protein
MSGSELAALAEQGQRRIQRYLTTAEVAELLRTSPETVRYWRHIGSGPKSFKVGRRVLYDVADVEAFIAAARTGNDAA